VGLSEQSSGKIKQPVVLPDLQGKAECGKEASLLTALFAVVCFYWCSLSRFARSWLLLWRQK